LYCIHFIASLVDKTFIHISVFYVFLYDFGIFQSLNPDLRILKNNFNILQTVGLFVIFVSSKTRIYEKVFKAILFWFIRYYKR